MRDFERRLEGEIPALRRYARALLRERERAEDLLQDCLERALSRRHLFVRPDNLQGWLFRLMRNLYLNSVRNGSRRPPIIELGEAPAAVSQADQISRIELAEAMTAFDNLPLEQRELMLLVLVEGYSYREAARLLGIPAGTVMSRMARAREQLRELRDNAGPRLRRVK